VLILLAINLAMAGIPGDRIPANIYFSFRKRPEQLWGLPSLRSMDTGFLCQV